MMATPSKGTPQRGPEDLAFQPLSFARDGTPRRTVPPDAYEKRKELSTRFFLNQMQASKSTASPAATPASTELASATPRFMAVAIAFILVPAIAFTLPAFLNGLNLQQKPGITWSTILWGQTKEDWSFGCHVTNITQDKEKGQVLFTTRFSDLPSEAFKPAKLQGILSDIVWQQVNELGDYGFNETSLAVHFSGSNPTIDANSTLGSTQEMLDFVGKLTTGTLADRLARNKRFRAVMTTAGFVPKSHMAPESIKGKWLEPMVENAAETQKEAAQGVMRYMYDVQKSYKAVQNLLHESESRESSLSKQVEAKAAALRAAQDKLGKLEKDLNFTIRELELAKNGSSTLKKWKDDATIEINKLQNEIADTKKSLQQREKALDKLTAEYTALKNKQQELEANLEGQTKGKSELQELRKQIAKEKDTLKSDLDTVVTKLSKVLEERFNDTSLKGSLSPTKLVKALDQQVQQASIQFTTNVKQVKAEVDSLQKELSDWLQKHKIELDNKEKGFNATLETKEKEFTQKLKLASTDKDKAVQEATKTLKSELTELSKKLKGAERTLVATSSKLEDAEKQIETKTSKIAELEALVDTTQKELKNVEAALAKSASEKQAIVQQQAAKEGEVSNLKTQYDAAQAQLKSQDDRISRMEKLFEKFISVYAGMNELHQEWQKLKST